MSITSNSVFRPSLRVVAAAVCLMAGLSRGIQAADEVYGEWEVKIDRNGRESFATLSLSKTPDGGLAGKWGRTELSEVKLDGSKLTFVRSMRFADQEFKVRYEGTVKDGAITGNVTSDRGSYAANATRPKPRSPALGSWNLKYTINDRAIDAVLAITEATGGALEAKWTNNSGEHVVSNVKLDGKKLSLARKSKIGDREVESTYEAIIDGNKISGTIKTSMGDFAANGSRAGADVIGNWELTTTTDRGARTGLLSVYGDLSGRYEVFGSEIPFKGLQVEGQQVRFSVESNFGDTPSTLDFKGTIDGKTLKGQVTSPRGTRDVTGKKLEAISPFVGTWEIVREGTQGTRTSKLSVKEDGTASYTSGDNTVGVTDLKLEGNEISFKATVKRGDRDVALELKGKLEGETLKAQVTTPRGTREATGKKTQ